MSYTNRIFNQRIFSKELLSNLNNTIHGIRYPNLTKTTVLGKYNIHRFSTSLQKSDAKNPFEKPMPFRLEDKKEQKEMDEIMKNKGKKISNKEGVLSVDPNLAEEKSTITKSNHPYDNPNIVKYDFVPFPNNTNPETKEIGGPKGPEPTRYGDWERKGRVSDF
ncbi:hypothetical protein BB559_004890 [Furculomyces boomerangus]|uniref:Succinate dehydrogenase assembly factor 4, mitochondrial n=2 Tax=Harpellales TaxID=61421 RepID=A0A2T9YC04_9FUNG|nr:hypothetical protein BB559_005857 [Furculomyces boomerangus]PVU89873.1 hypothetical protein BB559_004890 [Furculomyces boomerangus]PVZ96583.1 hypothetical protein BB558_007498 [Smittium angustum]PWA00835.1 hypothetical protein BB558_003098 [Smittium angustum]